MINSYNKPYTTEIIAPNATKTNSSIIKSFPEITEFECNASLSFKRFVKRTTNMATVESMVVEEQREPEKPVDREKVAGGIFHAY